MKFETKKRIAKAGEKIVITHVDFGDKYKVGDLLMVGKVHKLGVIDETDTFGVYHEQYEVLETVAEKPKFTKEDFEVGQLVNLREFNNCLVMEAVDGGLYVCNLEYGALININELETDLTCKDNDYEYDVMEVYGLSKYYVDMKNLTTDGRELLFKREE